MGDKEGKSVGVSVETTGIDTSRTIGFGVGRDVGLWLGYNKCKAKQFHIHILYKK